MKLLGFAAVAAVLVSSVAHAETITCVFSEPFVKTVYDSSQKTLAVPTRFDGQSVTHLRNVSQVSTGDKSFDLVSADGKVLQRLHLTFAGSDGMSEIVFPYDVRWNYGRGELRGGCSSETLKAQSPNRP